MLEITAIKGVGPVLAKACADRGYRNAKNIASATVADLKIVPGINDARAKQLIGAAKLLVKDASPADTATPAIEKAQPKKKKTRAKNDSAKKKAKISKKEKKKKSKKKKNKSKKGKKKTGKKK